MILVDTSVWIAHLRHKNGDLFDLLERRQVLSHPFVVGEVALGGVRHQTITLLKLLPDAEVSEDVEVLGLIQRHRLAGSRRKLRRCAPGRVVPSDARLWTRACSPLSPS